MLITGIPTLVPKSDVTIIMQPLYILQTVEVFWEVLIWFYPPTALSSCLIWQFWARALNWIWCIFYSVGQISKQAGQLQFTWMMVSRCNLTAEMISLSLSSFQPRHGYMTHNKLLIPRLWKARFDLQEHQTWPATLAEMLFQIFLLKKKLNFPVFSSR